MDNAKIEYTVKLKNIPREVQRRLQEMKFVLSECDNKLQSAIDNSSETYSHLVVDDIDIIRKNISYVDAVLAESANILNGFMDFKDGKYKEQDQKNDDIQDG